MGRFGNSDGIPIRDFRRSSRRPVSNCFEKAFLMRVDVLVNTWLAYGSSISMNSFCSGDTDKSVRYFKRMLSPFTVYSSFTVDGPLKLKRKIPLLLSSSSGYFSIKSSDLGMGGMGSCQGLVKAPLSPFEIIFASKGARTLKTSSGFTCPVMMILRFSGL